ncbi:hypothetical protein NBE98_09500 [Clostridium swellfunianum]|uniref:hypothetical protein n=1 Tax=Clostridium swellfunianum TaxID=1367462 RepID=UPI002030ADF5|nr:hypothetical protein [Clostridium swellfunianum]MCM0648607.1 hypothetical protein [Clostridium swellfunianum]
MRNIKPDNIITSLVPYVEEVDNNSAYFIERVAEPVTTFRIIPDINISNSQNEVLTHTFSLMYRTPRQRISIKNLNYTQSRQAYFDIMFEPQNVAKFYLTVHDEYSELVEGKLHTIYNKSEVRKTNILEVNDFNKSYTEVCEMVLRDYNFKSLSISKGDLYPLTNMMGVLKQLKGDEKIRINIAIEPIKRMNWINTAKDEFESYRRGKIVDNEMSTKDKAIKLGFQSAEALLSLYIEYKLLIFESILGIVVPEKKKEIPEENKFQIKIDSMEAIKQENRYNGLSPATTAKLTAESFKVRITIMSQSTDRNKAKLNMLFVTNSYKDLNEDNELVARFLSRKEQESLFDTVLYSYVPMSKHCILSDKEVSKLIQLPQRDLQQEYKIQNIDSREIDVPPELQDGKVRIGIAELRGKRINATWSRDKNVMALAKVFVGPQNAGKTTAIKRTVKDCYMANYSNIVIDFIESNDTAKEIAEIIPESDKVIIKLGEREYIPALAYNEVSRLITEDMDPWKRIRLANLIAEQVEYLINAVTDSSTGELTAPMLRYLHAASMVTFIRPGAKINDVFTILRRWDKRNEAIRYAKYCKCFGEEEDIFFDLEELHKREKDGGKIIGTREDLIIGIINRIIILQKNPDIKNMLSADINMDEDFTRYIEEGKNIFIMIPQNKFPNRMVRDILTTFYISRTWLTVQMRENNKDARLCNVIFDEVHQVPTTARFLSNHITEFRRHRLGLILSCHFLKQLRDLLTALKSSGASYVLIAGTEKENLEALKEELLPFTIEDGLKLKSHTSLNIINYGNQYAKFITSLPEK